MKKIKAFTLIELAMVLLVISVLFIGSFESSKYFMNQNNVRATIVKLNTIQNALEMYLLQNRKLPCPAGLKVSGGTALASCNSSNPTSGLVVSDGVARGGIPYEDLGLMADISYDAWKSKIIYSVTQAATENFRNIDTYSGISIHNNIQSGTTYLITDKGIYSLVSNGRNKFGAYNFNTNSQISTTGIPTYEDRNLGSAAANINVYFTDTNKTNDDIVVYKTRRQMITEAGYEDMGCYITSTIITNLITTSGIPDTPSFTTPSENYLIYNDEIKSSNKPYKIKCFKYGRLGIFKYDE